MNNSAVLSSLAGLLVCLASSATAAPSSELSQSTHPDSDSGFLEVVWGDPAPDDSTQPTTLDVSLVKPDGQRVRLDTKSASAAADDLGALNGRQVTVGYRAVPSAGPARKVDIIVAVTEGEPPVPVNRRWAVMGCRFPEDTGSLVPTAQMLAQYGQDPWRLGDYWTQVSWGHASMHGAADFGWSSLPYPKSSYEDADFSSGYDLSAMAQDCLDASGQAVELQPFDGLSMAFSSNFSNGWSGSAYGGRACLLVAGETVCRPNMWLPPWAHMTPSIIAHEMGHGYGLSHVDNSDGDSDPYDNPWDVMSSSWEHAVVHPAYGTQPKFLSMASRLKLGWVPDEALAFVQLPLQFLVSREFHLVRANASGVSGHHVVVVRMPIPNDHDGNPLPGQAALYVIEARTRENPYDQMLPGDAVIIHRAPTAGGAVKLVDPAVPPANFSSTESVMFRPGETYDLPDRVGRIRVQSQTATGFWVSVERI